MPNLHFIFFCTTGGLLKGNLTKIEMKIRYKSLIVLILFYILGIVGSMAQPRVIKGIVYGANGKPASGVTVTAHRSNETYFTSFDGAYELKADVKSKYIKFTFLDREEKVDIEGNTSDVIDFGKKAETAVNAVSYTHLTLPTNREV